MPIPDAPVGRATPSAVIVALFHQLHDELRGLIRNCDHAALNFVPCAGANSIATIVTHLLGSEAETVQTVAGAACTRDRNAEFARGTQPAEALHAQLDDADVLLDEIAPALTAARLQRTVALPTLPDGEMRPGLTWLVGNLGHAREHVGHAFLTKQLYEAGRTPA
jgi:hypothetical protein